MFFMQKRVKSFAQYDVSVTGSYDLYTKERGLPKDVNCFVYIFGDWGNGANRFEEELLCLSVLFFDIAFRVFWLFVSHSARRARYLIKTRFFQQMI